MILCVELIPGRLATAGPFRIAKVEPMVKIERRKAGRPKSGGPVRATVVALKGSPAWKAWLDDFSGYCRLGLANTIEQSLIYYAWVRQFRGPPKR